MTLNSMTGFGRSNGESGAWVWTWEVRSVNGRGLDLRVRLPSNFDTLDQPIRKRLQAQLKRGSVTVSLNVTRQAGAVEVKVNEAVLADVLKAAELVGKSTDTAPPRIDGLLALKGVLDVVEKTDSPELREQIEADMVRDFVTALNELVASRQTEGQKLSKIVSEKIDEISALTNTIENSPSRTPEKIQQRLKDQVAKLVNANDGLDETRLHQEAVLVATRGDVEEEVKRLAAHVSAAKALIEAKDPVGRQLDFLAQEFNREANTICSKAGANDISQAGLALKTAIDQMREQVQNIE